MKIEGNNDNIQEYKIIILGRGGVGKSALTLQFIRNTFVEEYDPTIEDSYKKLITLDNKNYLLDILDTAGQEEYNLMRDQYIRSGQGFLLVYSVDDVTSLEECISLYNHIKLIKENTFISCNNNSNENSNNLSNNNSQSNLNKPTVPCIIVGNKSDLINERVISHDQAKLKFKDLLNEDNIDMNIIETSAKFGYNVNQVFHLLVKQIIRNKLSMDKMFMSSYYNNTKFDSSNLAENKETNNLEKKLKKSCCCNIL